MLGQNESTSSVDPPVLRTMSADDIQCETLGPDAESVEKCNDVLYNGTNISVLQYYFAIHCLSKTAVNDLLALIADHMEKWPTLQISWLQW